MKREQRLRKLEQNLGMAGDLNIHSAIFFVPVEPDRLKEKIIRLYFDGHSWERHPNELEEEFKERAIKEAQKLVKVPIFFCECSAEE